MPLRVPDQTQWGHSPAGRRWAREDSGALIGRGRQRSHLRGVRPPGARAFRLAAAPGSFTSPTTSLWNEFTIWDMHCFPVTGSGSISAHERLSAYGAGTAGSVSRRGGLPGVFGQAGLARRIGLSPRSRSRCLGNGAGALALPLLPVSSLGPCGNAVRGHESALAALV